MIFKNNKIAMFLSTHIYIYIRTTTTVRYKFVSSFTFSGILHFFIFTKVLIFRKNSALSIGPNSSPTLSSPDWRARFTVVRTCSRGSQGHADKKFREQVEFKHIIFYLYPSIRRNAFGRLIDVSEQSHTFRRPVFCRHLVGGCGKQNKNGRPLI